MLYLPTEYLNRGNIIVNRGNTTLNDSILAIYTSEAVIFPFIFSFFSLFSFIFISLSLLNFSCSCFLASLHRSFLLVYIWFQSTLAIIGGVMLFLGHSTVDAFSIPFFNRPTPTSRMKERLEKHGMRLS
jgi:hypothetical protein